MLLKTRGIILRTLKYSETSLICDIYTEELGLQSCIFSGVRSSAKTSGAKAAILQLMTLVEMIVYHKTSANLHRTKEIRPVYVYQSLPFDTIKRSIGLFCIEIAAKTLREPEPNHGLFQFLIDFFTIIDVTETKKVGNFHLFFLLQLACYLGFEPQGEPSPDAPYFDMQEGVFVQNTQNQAFILDKEYSQLLHTLNNASIEEIAALPLKKSQRQFLLEKLVAYYNIHIENMPEIKSHTILKEIF
ncbi:MAG: hypothetical protein RI894_1408 [Bacteroidota bacterium]